MDASAGVGGVIIGLASKWGDVEQVAARRDRTNRQTGVPGRRVAGGDIDTLGAAGEAAVAIWAGCYSEWLDDAVRLTPQSQQADVAGLLHVRAAGPGRGRLGFGAKRGEFGRSGIARPPYIGPAGSLFGLESLRHWLQDHQAHKKGPSR